MNTRIVRFLFGTTIAGAIALVLLVLPMPRPIRDAPASTTYVVNSTLDEPNPDPSKGTCTSFPSGVCTLRAAIQAANIITAPNTGLANTAEMVF